MKVKQIKEIKAIITAAGMSSRMGVFKPLIKLGSTTFIEHVISNFQKAGICKIIVVCGNKMALVKNTLKDLDVKIVPNFEYASTDMLYSIKKGLLRLNKNCSGFFITTVDTPIFSSFSIKNMIKIATAKDKCIIIPKYKNKEGHPVYISSHYIKDILNYEENYGLKGFLDKFEDDKIYLNIPDPGITMNINTPSDLVEIQDYFKNIDIPSYEQCLEIQNFFNMNDNINAHCSKVCEIAQGIGKQFMDKGINVNMKLIIAASLLHDIAKGIKHHDKVGAKFMKEMGFYDVSDIILNHMSLNDPIVKEPYEKYIVYLADKLVKGDSYVGVNNRFDAKILKTKDEDVKSIILKKKQTALYVEEQIKDILK